MRGRHPTTDGAIGEAVAAAPVRGRAARDGTGAVVCMLCPGDLKTGKAGGMGTCIAYLTAEMPRADPTLRIELYDTRGPGHLASSPVYFGAALARVARHALRGRAPLVHAHMAARGSAVRKLATVVLAAPLRIPTIVHLHGSGYDEWYRGLPAPARAAVRWAHRLAGRTIALSGGWKRFLVEEIGLPADRVDVVCNGVPEPAAPAGREAAPVHLVFLGHLCERKGVSTLLAALASPELGGLEWRATLAGDGDRDAYRERARGLGIGGRVDFPGWLDMAGVDRLLATASALVLPSHAEGLPMAVLEALARRVPVVTTPVGSIPEFLADRVSALLVRPGDAAALSRALGCLIRSPELRSLLAAEGRLVFEGNFSIAAVARQVAASYGKVLASAGR